MSWLENFVAGLFARKKSVGLALGGGMARAIAHVGVVKVLKTAGVPIDFVAATSAGSLVGAAVASGMEIELIEQVMFRIHWSNFFKLTFFRPGITSSEAIEEFVIKYVGDLQFSDLKLPFATVATDVKSGRPVILNKGSVAKAVAASATFPGLFAPSQLDGKILVDGGINSNVPVDAARGLGADFVIASDVIPAKIHEMPRDAMQVVGRSLDLVLKKLSVKEAKRADVLLELELPHDLGYLDLNRAKEFVAAGELAAHRRINQIKRDLGLRA